jgi:hypothetical protein
MRSDGPGLKYEVHEPSQSGYPQKLSKNVEIQHHSTALATPLSVCTSQFTDVSVKDVVRWANRSERTRRKEAQSRHGYVARPLNSFMLYGKAYLERARAWCKHDVQQHLSQTLASSWRIELPDVRQYYQRCAALEHKNHAKAYPQYKFSPGSRSRTTVCSRRKKYGEQAIAPKEPEKTQTSLVLRYQELVSDRPDGQDSGTAPSRMLEELYCGLPQYCDVDFADTRNIQTPPTFYNDGVSPGSAYYSYHCGFGALCHEGFGCACQCMMHAGAYDIYNGSPYTRAQAASFPPFFELYCGDALTAGGPVEKSALY